MNFSLSIRLASLLAALVASSAASAAGGHHSVDDAAILEPGQCELEGWATRSRGGERLLHAGAGCRLGPLELGLAAEHARADGTGQSHYALQAKWAREWLPGLSAGWSLATGWQARARPRHQGATLAGLVTWAAHDTLALHLNLGRDLVAGEPDQGRSGVSLEWAARPGWTVLAERYYEERTHFARAGLRWAASESWTLDLSRARRLAGPGGSAWTLGASWQFSRP